MKNEEELENPGLTFVNSIVKFIDWIKDAIKNKKSIEYNFGYHCDWMMKQMEKKVVFL